MILKLSFIKQLLNCTYCKSICCAIVLSSPIQYPTLPYPTLTPTLTLLLPLHLTTYPTPYLLPYPYDYPYPPPTPNPSPTIPLLLPLHITSYPTLLIPILYPYSYSLPLPILLPLLYQYHTLTSTPNHNLPKLLPLPGYPYYHCCYSLTYHTLTPTLPVFIFLSNLTSYHFTYSLPYHPLTPTPTVLFPSPILPYSALPSYHTLPCRALPHLTPPYQTLSLLLLLTLLYPTLTHYSTVPLLLPLFSLSLPHLVPGCSPRPREY